MSETTGLPDNLSSFDLLEQRALIFRQAATDARNLMRTNLIILGLFFPIIAALFSDELPLERLFNNPYTQIGLLIWLVSTVLLTFTYGQARNAESTQFSPIEDEIIGSISSSEQYYQIKGNIGKYTELLRKINRRNTWCMRLSLVAATFLALGALLPYVSLIPQITLFQIILVSFGICVVLVVVVHLGRRVWKIRERKRREWGDLTKPRQDIFKKIYTAVGKDSFQLKSPLLSDEDDPVRVLDTSQLDQTHVLLRDVPTGTISRNLLNQLVEEGYFKTQGGGERIVNDPTAERASRIHQSDQLVTSALDRFVVKLESDTDAQERAADEIGVRPEELFRELRSGNNIKKINRYNRLIDCLEDDGFHLGSRPLSFDSTAVRYTPTGLAKKMYKSIEQLEQDRLSEQRE